MPGTGKDGRKIGFQRSFLEYFRLGFFVFLLWGKSILEFELEEFVDG